jgi:hypothetical protein
MSNSRKKLVTVEEGEVYAIPLFVSDEDPSRRFKKADFEGKGQQFAFLRIVTDTGGGGIIVEIFDLVGGLDMPVAEIVQAQRLFRPVAITGLGIHKRRWPRIGRQVGYDMERDSCYSAIELVSSPFDHPTLFRGGKQSPISIEQAAKHEPWTMWRAHHLEKRIISELTARGTRLAVP